MRHLFVYGTLLFPEIVFGLCRKNFVTQTAKLSGFKRVSVKECDYPAIIPDEVSAVDGKLLLDVDEESMRILTFFEGENYIQKEVFVSSGSKTVKAQVFVWNGQLGSLAESDWDKDKFVQKSRKYYVTRVIPETAGEYVQLRKQQNT